MDSEIHSKARARSRAHVRAAEHYKETNVPKSIAHYKRALHYSAFGSFTKPVSLRFNGLLDSLEDVIKEHRTFTECTAEIVGAPGGVTEVGYGEYKRCKDSRLLTKIATVVASNSGRPGGACRKSDGTLDITKIHAHHKTQEEDVISNWMVAATDVVSDDQESQKAMMNEIFKPVSGAFGLVNPNGTDIITKQNVDYTLGMAIDVKTRDWEYLGPRVYADAWRYEGATLCEKKALSTIRKKRTRRRSFSALRPTRATPKVVNGRRLCFGRTHHLQTVTKCTSTRDARGRYTLRSTRAR